MLMLSYKDMHKSGPKCNVITCDDSLIRCLSINEMEVLTKLFFRIVIYIQKKRFGSRFQYKLAVDILVQYIRYILPGES